MLSTDLRFSIYMAIEKGGCLVQDFVQGVWTREDVGFRFVTIPVTRGKLVLRVDQCVVIRQTTENQCLVTTQHFLVEEALEELIAKGSEVKDDLIRIRDRIESERWIVRSSELPLARALFEWFGWYRNEKFHWRYPIFGHTREELELKESQLFWSLIEDDDLIRGRMFR